MAKESVESRVETLLKDIIEDLGYDLYDVEYSKEGKDYYLRVFIDSSNGISLEDCEKVNNAIDEPLDRADLIPEQYFLEVSSIGLEKKLRKDEHFISSIGSKLEIKLYQKVNGQKALEGILEDYKDDKVFLRIDDELIQIEKSNIATAKTVYDWE
ncbi:MAG: ribosome maturation factor RimP [Clostridia bacterium]|nr:ribosome maturation factor RimP [Clostridia bacterium]